MKPVIISIIILLCLILWRLTEVYFRLKNHDNPENREIAPAAIYLFAIIWFLLVAAVLILNFI